MQLSVLCEDSYNEFYTGHVVLTAKLKHERFTEVVNYIYIHDLPKPNQDTQQPLSKTSGLEECREDNAENPKSTTNDGDKRETVSNSDEYETLKRLVSNIKPFFDESDDSYRKNNAIISFYDESQFVPTDLESKSLNLKNYSDFNTEDFIPIIDLLRLIIKEILKKDSLTEQKVHGIVSECYDQYLKESNSEDCLSCSNIDDSMVKMCMSVFYEPSDESKEAGHKDLKKMMEEKSANELYCVSKTLYFFLIRINNMVFNFPNRFFNNTPPNTGHFDLPIFRSSIPEENDFLNVSLHYSFVIIKLSDKMVQKCIQFEYEIDESQRELFEYFEMQEMTIKYTENLSGKSGSFSIDDTNYSFLFAERTYSILVLQLNLPEDLVDKIRRKHVLSIYFNDMSMDPMELEYEMPEDTPYVRKNPRSG